MYCDPKDKGNKGVTTKGNRGLISVNKRKRVEARKDVEIIACLQSFHLF